MCDFLDELAITSENKMATQISNPESRTGSTLPNTMRAVVYHGINDMRVETVAVPRIGPGELLIKSAPPLASAAPRSQKIHGLGGAAHLRREMAEPSPPLGDD